jgi:uncharacterized protein (TIGR02246 family)
MAFGSGSPVSSDTPAGRELRPVEALIEHESRAWNAGDAVAFSEAVAADCVFTNIFGQVFIGRPAFAEQHARIFATVYRGSRLEQTVEHLRIVQPDVALVDTSVVLSIPPTPALPGRIVRTKLAQVLVRKTGAWQVMSYHNVEVRPAPAM